jgi:hypothetical protein
VVFKTKTGRLYLGVSFPTNIKSNFCTTQTIQNTAGKKGSNHTEYCRKEKLKPYRILQEKKLKPYRILQGKKSRLSRTHKT